MPPDAPLYDLMLLLSNLAEEERRAKIVDDVRQAISSGGGSIAHDSDWGTRALAYRISHQTDAHYHLLQFTGPAALLESLDHSLRITDGVLRFRIIKVLPGTPGPPKPESVATVAPTRAEPATVGAPQRAAGPATSAPVAGSGSATESEAGAESGGEAESEAGTESGGGSESEDAARSASEAGSAPEAAE
jgi:small subunit ribosomal protein S6